MRPTKTRMAVSTRTTLSTTSAPPSGTGTFEPYFKGANVLTDPNFENFRDNSGGWYFPDRIGGSTMFTVPFLDLTCPSFLRWPDGSCTENLLVGWCQTSGPYGSQLDDSNTDPMWHISTFDSLGQYGAVWFQWGRAVGSIVPAELSAFSPSTAPFSCRVEPGDSVNWSGNIRCGVSSGASVVLILRFYNSSGSLFLVSQTSSAINSTRAVYSIAQTAPAGAHYLRSTFAFTGTGFTPSATLVVDSAKLGIT